MIRTALVLVFLLVGAMAAGADSLDGNSDGSDFLFEGDAEAALAWAASYGCSWPICNVVSELLGGQYVQQGFLVTGLEGPPTPIHPLHDREFLSFGIWAQNSYVGFWQKANVVNPAAFDPVDPKTWGVDLDNPLGSFLFFAGGRNPAKPTTGTWRGLAFGRHELFPGVRVGRSKIVVNLAASELDVTITGLVAGTGAAFATDGNRQDVEIGNTLTWKGLPLHTDGSFDEPRTYGARDSLDDVFAADLPLTGEYYPDTAGTIEGQFYGPNGDEVAGVFHKNGIQGSFGAYRGD